jgi:hypothetical protein
MHDDLCHLVHIQLVPEPGRGAGAPSSLRIGNVMAEIPWVKLSCLLLAMEAVTREEFRSCWDTRRGTRGQQLMEAAGRGNSIKYQREYRWYSQRSLAGFSAAPKVYVSGKPQSGNNGPIELNKLTHNIILDEMWMPSILAVASWICSNRKDFREIPTPNEDNVQFKRIGKYGSS